MRSLSLAVVAACAIGAGATLLAQQQAHSFLVTVTDETHKPVTGLGAEDFAVKDGGARQPVVSAEPATGPMAVAFASVQSPSQAVAHDWADDAIRPAEAIVREANVDNDVLDSHTLLTSPGPTFPIASTVIAGTVRLGTSAADRRAVLVVVDGRADADLSLQQHLRAARASLWVVDVAATPAVATPQLDSVIAWTGGMHISAKDSAALADAARDVATLLTKSQYLVRFDVAAMATAPLPLATRHDRGIVLLPSWPQ
jgi:hypothetical protein